MADVGGHPLTEADWEAAWAPYDEATYRAALELVQPDDVVLDIGAGDLRLALRLANIARHVYAVERRADVLGPALERWVSDSPLPANLTVVCADARYWPFPSGLTVGVLLMRHCRHFGLYVSKLRAVGARLLITNARWGMGLEAMDLSTPGLAWDIDTLAPGWYACVCGAVGFVEGPPTMPIDLEVVQQVEECPKCVCKERK